MRRGAVIACTVWDVTEAVRLRRDPRLRATPRLVADLADMAGWSAVTDRPPPVVPALAVPLVTETALRYPVGGRARRPRLRGRRRRLPQDGGQAAAAHQPRPPRPGSAVRDGLRRVERAGAARTTFDAESQAVETSATIAGQYAVARSTYEVRGERLNPHDVLPGVRLHFPGGA